MMFPLLFLIGSAAMQAAPTPPVEISTSRVGRGRFFVSPMGEPFYGRTPGEDGLVVWFEQADLNHDGALTVDEMVADADRFLAVLDRQKDGEIDPDDMDYYESTIAPQVRATPIVTTSDLPGGGQSVHVDNESSSGLYSLFKMPQPVASADTNFNRGVSPTEFEVAAKRRFHSLDAAGTGRLTLDELQGVRRAAIAEARRRPNQSNDATDSRTAENGAASVTNQP